jgi:hypothetical protein
MAVFYLDDGRSGEEVTRDLLAGRAVLLKKPVAEPRMLEALDLVEENRDWETVCRSRREWVK